MSDRNLKLLILITAILLIFIGIKTFLPRLLSVSSPYLEKIKSLDKNSVSVINIKNSQTDTPMKKVNSHWQVNNKKADTEKIGSLLDFLLSTDAPELIARTRKRHKEFGLDNPSATKITLDNRLSWLLGKSVNYSVYTRFEGEDSVYLLNNSSSADISPDVNLWYDKTVISFDASRAAKLTVKKDILSEIKLYKKDNKWLFEKTEKEASQDKINDILTALSSLRASSLAAEQDLSKYPKNPVLSVTVGYDSQTSTLEFFKGENDYLIRRLSDGELFTVSEYSISSLLSFPEDI